MSERTKITGLETINFPSTMDGAILTTKDASKYVNAFFSRIFSDYAGCIIRIDQTINPEDPQSQLKMAHPVQVDLYFKATPTGENEGAIRAFRLAGEKDSKDEATPAGSMGYTNKITSWNAAITENKVTCITQEAVDIMYDLLWYELRRNIPEKNINAKIYNDRGISVETCINNSGMPSYQNDNNKIVYGVIRYVDINEVFKLIFGDKVDDAKVFYQINPIKPIIQFMVGMAGNIGEQKWLLYLNRLNDKSMRNILSELGSGPAMGPNIETAR